MSDIISYIHCTNCITNERKDRLEVGLTDPFTLRVWCSRCSSLVSDFTLARAIMPRCDVCGEPIIGPNHKH